MPNMTPSSELWKKSGGISMFLFIAGVLVGSLSMLFTISLMFAAKKGDQHVDPLFNEKAY